MLNNFVDLGELDESDSSEDDESEGESVMSIDDDNYEEDTGSIDENDETDFANRFPDAEFTPYGSI